MRQPLPLCVPCVFCLVPGDSRYLHINYTLDKGMTKGMPVYVKGTSLAREVILKLMSLVGHFSNNNFFSEFPVLFVLISDTSGYCAPEVPAVRCAVFLSGQEGRACGFGFFIEIKPTNLKTQRKKSSI